MEDTLWVPELPSIVTMDMTGVDLVPGLASNQELQDIGTNQLQHATQRNTIYYSNVNYF